MANQTSLFERLKWRDPVSGTPLEPIITGRAPGGGPVCGALRIVGTNEGYPIVDNVARLTPELAQKYADWLLDLGLHPPQFNGIEEAFQLETTVSSFGFQWQWNSEMRSEEDMRWRVAERFERSPSDFSGKIALDAGAGAGDQSRWLIEQGAQVVSIDLSDAIDVVARKLRHRPNWVGIQGDIAVLPLAADQFDLVYCEGVLQHTRDSAATVEELCRVLRPGGLLQATHQCKAVRHVGRIKLALTNAVRRVISRWPRYQLLLLTGILAALAYLPMLGRAMRLSGIAVYSELMPDFKTTWTNTFDLFNDHDYHRYLATEEFHSYFQNRAMYEPILMKPGIVVIRKCS